jgi:hypothetical protein
MKAKDNYEARHTATEKWRKPPINGMRNSTKHPAERQENWRHKCACIESQERCAEGRNVKAQHNGISSNSKTQAWRHDLTSLNLEKIYSSSRAHQVEAWNWRLHVCWWEAIVCWTLVVVLARALE